MATDEQPDLPVDLRPADRTAALIERGLAETLAAPHRAALATATAGLDPAVQAFGETLLTALGGLAAEVEMLRQRLAAAERSRAERIRIDPLPLIAAGRPLLPPVPPLPEAAVLEAGDPDLVGHGWGPPEGEPGGPLCRRAAPGGWAALRLPAIAGAAAGLRLTLTLRPPAPAGLTALLDALPLEFHPAGETEGLVHLVAETARPAVAAPHRPVLLLRPRTGGRGPRIALALVQVGLEGLAPVSDIGGDPGRMVS